MTRALLARSFEGLLGRAREGCVRYRQAGQAACVRSGEGREVGHAGMSLVGGRGRVDAPQPHTALAACSAHAQCKDWRAHWLNAEEAQEASAPFVWW